MSQAKLARRLDMNASQLNKYISGERQPPDQFWKAAADILGVDVSEIRPTKEAAA
jgi:transcriptional regulator with XRE-family HTH domain